MKTPLFQGFDQKTSKCKNSRNIQRFTLKIASDPYRLEFLVFKICAEYS